MQSNPPPDDLQISRLIPQSFNRNHVTILALIPDYSATTSVPHFYNYCYYGELKPQAGYLRPEIGWSQQEHFQYHYPPPHHLDMRVMTEREIEKDRIREEMIWLDIARRHALEAEVRWLLMMERESVPQRGSNGFPFSSLRTSLYESLMRLSCSVTKVEERWVLVDMIAKLLEERERLNEMIETGRVDTLPFERGTSSLKISEVRPALHEDNKGKKIILLDLAYTGCSQTPNHSEIKLFLKRKVDRPLQAMPKLTMTWPKPDDNASGSKREAETLDARMKKRATVEWSCAVCKFSAFSERQLNEHLQGRKHKNQESKMLTAQKGSNNYRIGFAPKNSTKHKSAAQSLAFSETQVGSLKKDHVPPLRISLNSYPWKKNESKLDPNIRRGEKLMKRRRRAHKRSKKRASRLHIVEHNCAAGQSMIPATIKEPQER